MVRSSVLVCALAAAAFLLIAVPRAESVVTCGTVTSALPPCINYIRKQGSLTPTCCDAVRGLNAASRTPSDRRTACGCLKTLATKIPGVDYGLVYGVPRKCGVNVPYAISPSTDCTRVH